MLLNAPGHHAHVGGSANDHTAQATTQLKQSISDLFVEALLDLQLLCIDSEKLHKRITRNLLGPRSAAISKVCVALKREDVMLAL